MTSPIDPVISGSSHPAPPPSPPPQKRHWLIRLLLWIVGLAAAGAATLALLLLVALSVAYPNLPDVSSLQNYQPKLPLRIYSSEGNLISEFGEERRSYVPFNEIPKVMKDAVLAVEDARFYEHGGIDYVGVARAGLANFGKSKSQGASTITMQVARNVYLSSEKTFTRKIYEMLLAFKLEHSLSKDQIFEIYLNQIFLGNRAYGFAAASEAYFGKSIKDVSIAEAAMLAGLPKAPSLYNPIVNPSRARTRQLYILDRMVENRFITPEQAEQAKNEQLVYKRASYGDTVHAEYVGEMVRQLIYDQYGAEAYTRGLNVYTTISTRDQNAAYEAVRRGILGYDSRRAYRGPEHFVTLPKDKDLLEEAISDALVDYPDAGEMVAAVVTEASPRKVVARRSDNENIAITGNGLRFATFALSSKATATQKIRPGAIIRIVKAKDGWEIRQLPEVESALVAMDPRSGAIQALVGGFDYNKNKFNHVTQAYRQPGSSFKPFIYSAGLETGIMPTTVVSDSALYFGSDVTGGKPWSPKNYDGSNGPPLTVRQALVGGFDYNKNKFNHVTQAYRQPGSSFKPFIYSAGLETGIMPTTVVSDSALYFGSDVTGGKPWSPKNYDGSNGPPLTVRQALAKSKNMVSIRILQSVGTQKTQEWAGRFGFPADRTPPYLTLALGAGTVTPLEMAVGYAVFANGGYAVNPYIISMITDQRGNTISEIKPTALTEDRRAIPARNAFVMNSLMNEVTTRGTAARATGALGRSDLYGKTGTTNDSKDAWFAGFQATQVAVVWMGFDNPRNLGDRETGGGLSLPIWIQYMQTALKGVPVTDLNRKAPEGVTRQGDWVYEEYAGGRGISRIGVSNYNPNPGRSKSGGQGSDSSDGEPQGADPAGAPSNSPLATDDLFRGN